MESESSTTAIVSCLTKEAETVLDNFSSPFIVLLVRRLRGEGDGDGAGDGECEEPPYTGCGGSR